MIVKEYLGAELSLVPSDLFHHGFDDPSLLDQRYPSLVLAAVDKVPLIAANWFLAYQDCDGFGCGSESAAILPLSIKPEILSELIRIVDEEFAGDGGLDYFLVMNPDDARAIRGSYLGAISKLGLTCTSELSETLTQALYPIDATNANLNILSNEKVNLEEIEKSGSKLCIYIVGANCD